MSARTKLTDNSAEILTQFEKQADRGAEAIGQTAEGYAKADCPVDTGRLRNSISHAVKEDGIYIGTNVIYAAPVEYNENMKHTTGKAHFLRDAATQHSSEYKNLMKGSLEGSR